MPDARLAEQPLDVPGHFYKCSIARMDTAIECGYVVYSPQAKQRLLGVGSREQVQLAAAVHGLKWLAPFHQRALAGERA